MSLDWFERQYDLGPWEWDAPIRIMADSNISITAVPFEGLITAGLNASAEFAKLATAHRLTEDPDIRRRYDLVAVKGLERVDRLFDAIEKGGLDLAAEIKKVLAKGAGK